MTPTKPLRLAQKKGYLVIVPGLGSRSLSLENEWYQTCKLRHQPYSCDRNLSQSAVKQFHYVMQRMEHRRIHEWFLGVECLSSNRIRLDDNQMARLMEWLLDLCRQECVSHTIREDYDSNSIAYRYDSDRTWAKYFHGMNWSNSLDEFLANNEA